MDGDSDEFTGTTKTNRNYNIMTLNEIRQKPTTIDTGENSRRVHESILRSWHIVEKIKELLELNTPAEVILELIEDLKSARGVDFEIGEK